MGQTIPVFVINLKRRADRLARVSEHLAARGVSWQRVDACDAQVVSSEVLDRVTVTSEGPLGYLALGDRACTVSHTYAWEAFLAGKARYGLFLEDDVYLSEDIAEALASDSWLPAGARAVKLEKFGSSASRLLLGPSIGRLSGGRRKLHRMYSRHVGGCAYILSRDGADIALLERGRIRVPVDHLLFNDTVSPIFRRLQPLIVVPSMATQQRHEDESDTAEFRRIMRPTGWKLKKRKLRRGLCEINQLHRQFFALVTGKAQIKTLFWQEN